MRQANITRKTAETDIALKLNIDGSGAYKIDTGIGFFDHMLMQLSRHSLIDIELTASGDRHIDDHHLCEDVGIVLGQALLEARGDAAGIARYGHCLLPMDDALIQAAIDISGRAYLKFALVFPVAKIGNFDSELIEEFFRAFSSNALINLHLACLAGDNAHHMAEAAFKATARSLRMALALDGAQEQRIPSTKGQLRA